MGWLARIKQQIRKSISNMSLRQLFFPSEDPRQQIDGTLDLGYFFKLELPQLAVDFIFDAPIGSGAAEVD